MRYPVEGGLDPVHPGLDAMLRIGGRPTVVAPKPQRSWRQGSPGGSPAGRRPPAGAGPDRRLTAGTPLEPSNVNARLHKLLTDAGVPRQRLHDLRHCCASLLLAQHVSPRVVMYVIGHSLIELTTNTYSHVMPAMLKDAAAALDAAIAVGA